MSDFLLQGVLFAPPWVSGVSCSRFAFFAHGTEDTRAVKGQEGTGEVQHWNVAFLSSCKAALINRVSSHSAQFKYLEVKLLQKSSA